MTIIKKKVIPNLTAASGDIVFDCLYAERRPTPVSSSQLTTKCVHSSSKNDHIINFSL